MTDLIGHWLIIIDFIITATKEKKSVQFNEEVQVKTMEPIPDVIEIDEVCTTP